MESKHKHLEFVQGVIARLAGNSFKVRTWAVVLTSTILAILAREGRLDFGFVALFPILAFWGLDGYYLWQERRFRALYDHVRGLHDDDVDFSMNADAVVHGCPSTWMTTMFSGTLMLFYATLMALSLASICLR